LKLQEEPEGNKLKELERGIVTTWIQNSRKAEPQNSAIENKEQEPWMLCLATSPGEATQYLGEASLR
jgi:hypothetical protein